MKIDSPGPDIRHQALDGVGRPTAPAGAKDIAASTPPAAAVDEVRLSSDGQLLQAAVQAAQQLPDIRPDVVERMRAALAKGEIGNDPHALADTLIDRMLGNSSD
jgi:flagellar biosynthesis anti-sigma factor FlgM